MKKRLLITFLNTKSPGGWYIQGFELGVIFSAHQDSSAAAPLTISPSSVVMAS
jgi:hypothetical protein